MSTSKGYSCHHSLTKRFDYKLPSWAEYSFSNVPQHGRLHLGNYPTPLYRLFPNDQSEVLGSRSVLKRLVTDFNIGFYVKRDDMCGGAPLEGNKVRKLELLLADALAKGKRSVITAGGEQSNHCRATAVTCRMVGLEPHLILRSRRSNEIQANTETFGFTGNILFDRLSGATSYLCTPGEYARLGSEELIGRLAKYLEETDPNKPVYKIPVGGSNGLGSFGYLNAVDELLSQWYQDEDGDESSAAIPSIDHIVVACGSGGTVAGLTLGIALAHQNANNEKPIPAVHAIGVCDSPDYFYNFIAKIADEMGLILPDGVSTEEFVRKHVTAYPGQGLGYARSTKEELDFISDFSLETGIVLDPVYSGKAMYHFITNVLAAEPEKFQNTNIVFIHTGGTLGMFDKGDELISKLQEISPVKRLDIYGKPDFGVDISKELE